MAKKEYDWDNGAKLEDHTKKKHEILKEYFRQYLITRCKIPQMEKFRLAIVDGFSGAGQYSCGEFGSPLIFIHTLNEVVQEINLSRTDKGMKPIFIECLLMLNDADPTAIQHLKVNVAPYLAGIVAENPNLNIHVEYFHSKFEDVYPEIKQRLTAARCSNVLFNLDQCGYSQIKTTILRDIMTSWKSAEIILTFMIKSLLTYLSPSNENNAVPLEDNVKAQIQDLLQSSDGVISKPDWLGKTEQLVFEYLKACAPYVSPFSINNPHGWQYWLMHFANAHRARQVYNNVLYENENAQAHFGRSGLKMLSYDPSKEGQLFLFNQSARDSSKEELYDDIPRVISDAGDVLSIEDFYKTAYSETAAHSDDIHEMMIENPDVEVLTEAGRERRKPNTIKPTDTLKLKGQTSFYSLLGFPKK
ncbi:three-Cys-motif partner protein TcmP [Sneathiella aquimaris]|uniref:three-Cys-motif partner protein TcmP n=1 Tax=Sneathiella aquimaris TaxID=2599305 RepID=UPI00146DE77F|nr:three-Cys-motif partner protein TcmP [Sneathiella aquimaris]